MELYDYYIRVKDGIIIDAFTTAFKQPEKGDIKIKEKQSERCWSLPLLDEETFEYQYKYDKKEIKLRTKEEIKSSRKYLEKKNKEEYEREIEEEVMAILREMAIDRIEKRKIKKEV